MFEEASLVEFVKRHDVAPLLPLHWPERPIRSASQSARLRQRFKKKLLVWKIAVGMISVVNGLFRGRCETLTSPSGCDDRRMKVTDARILAVNRILQAAAAIAKERRGLDLTGARSAAATLLKTPSDEQGYIKTSGVKQVSMIADRMVEPKSPASICMLAALPDEDSLYYADEVNVVDRVGKSEALFTEIESHYGFVGGEQSEYIKYLERPDVQHLWQWSHMSAVRAVAGISTVLKKNGIDQRKLIMQCAANYMFEDPTKRAKLGMGGGSALARCHIPSDSMSLSACDEDSAFTYIAVPHWMRYWQAAPPLHASLVWHLLPQQVRDEVCWESGPYVAPLYCRLAMGGTHSVYILMRINIEHIGRTLRSYASRCLLPVNKPSAVDGDEQSDFNTGEADILDVDPVGRTDEEWVSAQASRRAAQPGASGYTVQQWCDAVRRARSMDGRVFVCMHFFSGERRDGDIQQYLETKALASNIQVLMVSVDLATDPLWDFTNPTTFHKIYSLCSEGLVDLVIGGPPCSTVARSRHVPLPGGRGPRPLRYRWCPWGRQDLTPWEFQRVRESNDLWINYMAICESVSTRSGGHLWEHPADPGVDPYPSVWITDEMIALEERTGAVRAIFHQCPFGGPVGLQELNNVWCPGVSAEHRHGPSIGVDDAGNFHTRRLQTYPPGLCEAIAELMHKTLIHMYVNSVGPTGPLRDHTCPQPRNTYWSSRAGRHRGGVLMLNEAVEQGESTRLSYSQAAVYVHVDDTVCIGDSDRGPFHSDSLLDAVVGALEQVGFAVSQQQRDDEVNKILGYEVQRSPAMFRLPRKKMVLLGHALMEESQRKHADIPLLRSLVGMWIHGALLRRELLSIPHSVFKFMDTCEEAGIMSAKWWNATRLEVQTMARSTGFMEVHVGAPILPWLFATDAMGSNEKDYGGYGIVMTEVSTDEVDSLLRHGELLGRTVARLDVCGGAKFGERDLQPTVPFTLLPDKFFVEERWQLVSRGRWQYKDHITIGESRAVVKMLNRVAAWPRLHQHFLFSLQDNRPTACAMAKGRSTSFSLNRILRQKAAICLAACIRVALPWVETAKQPADKASRIW